MKDKYEIIINDDDDPDEVVIRCGPIDREDVREAHARYYAYFEEFLEWNRKRNKKREQELKNKNDEIK